MRPFDDIPIEEGDYSDVALMVASAREWPAEDFARDLDARVARRFAPEAAPAAHRTGPAWLSRWTAGPAVALVAAATTAVIVLSGGGATPVFNSAQPPTFHALTNTTVPRRLSSAGAAYGGADALNSSAASDKNAPNTASGAASQQTMTTATSASNNGAVNFAAAAPAVPGAKQIQSAAISLTTANQHVNQVAQEVFTVVGNEQGTVLSSHITTATSSSGGGYASFSLSIPTGNLQATITELSRLHFASVLSRDDGSQNVSNQYNSDQRQLGDAKALRASLLKQLQTAYTQSDIDSIKAQLKLAEQQITSWQNTLGSLQHRISYSNVSVQINENGLPVIPVVHHPHHASGFTIGKAGHDALHVLVVSAGVALITLAVLIPVGLVAALLMWLWVWLRQRRREHALDTAS